MIITNVLPSEGYLRLHQIIGQKEITKEQAEFNRNNPVVTAKGNSKFIPKRPRPGIPAIIPTSKTQWYAGIRKKIYPAPLHLGKTAVWKVSDIRKLIENPEAFASTAAA